MRTIGVPLFAHTICRSVADQNEAYIRGRSKARAGQSPHNYGLAVDIIHGIKAWDLTRKQWDILGHVGAEVAAAQGVKLEWGGNWQFWDPAHWELANWRELRASLKQV
nr:M15 family metallopeptidase [uncultured Gellertiella sp.]